jgi:hypothetical protein
MGLIGLIHTAEFTEVDVFGNLLALLRHHKRVRRLDAVETTPGLWRLRDQGVATRQPSRLRCPAALRRSPSVNVTSRVTQHRLGVARDSADRTEQGGAGGRHFSGPGFRRCHMTTSRRSCFHTRCARLARSATETQRLTLRPRPRASPQKMGLTDKQPSVLASARALPGAVSSACGRRRTCRASTRIAS